ncbi:Bacterio-opsin activator HTH domain protein [Haladaptatus paucihalophilus DX253]|uniref:Bacterio-opsin activator HTH domain protein n=1 Tax=Haladaptatus paucihalophilus DX253 TaxID=797209 RepID=E7QNA5_HALPU|nr:helix-turn-helix domain-containing protein [Haladaptatus paucihalophilus]EFW93900.1 Bacterio-opsin activator HTH domain protein [Haladaptatus paucihalophilus DX253]SHK67373.1 Predicted DNA binding protein, contains HTH domain [Haladaptatus paucihalophilus DX253]
MSVIAEFTISAPDLVLTATLEAVPEMTVELEQQMASSSETALLIVWATGGDFDAFNDALHHDSTIESHSIVEELDVRKLYRLRMNREALFPVYPAYQELGAVPMAGHGADGTWTRRVRFPERTGLVEFQQFCNRNDIAFSLERLYTPGDSETAFQLTEPQREALVSAHESGYFEVPRDATLSELSSTLNISKQSVSERLRRAQSRLVENTILGKRKQS